MKKNNLIIVVIVAVVAIAPLSVYVVSKLGKKSGAIQPAVAR